MNNIDANKARKANLKKARAAKATKSTSSKKSTNSKRTTKKSNDNAKMLDNMKYEIASELGTKLGPDATARANGSVGGAMTKKLTEMGKNAMKKGK